MLVLLTASCSRQLASLKSTSDFQSASVLGSEKTSDKTVKISHEVVIDHAFAPVQERSVSEPKLSGVLARIHVPEYAKKEAVKVIMMASSRSGNTVLSPTHITERGDPQINKAGFILIAGGILGYLLHLILIACIIIAAIGLFVLLSPLFHKRY